MFVYNSKSNEYEETLDLNYDEFCEDKKEQNIFLFRENNFRNSRCGSTRSNNLDFVTRVISKKSGRRNIYLVKVPNKRITYFRDLGNTLLNIRWRWILIILCLVNVISFYFFGLLWMWLAYISGDFDENVDKFCVVNTKNLTGYILLSMETMLTIGYGYRYPTENCIQGWILPFLQALVSVGIQGVLISAVYVKISKPFTKNTVGLFSRKAVIYLRDGSLCLVIRVTDLYGKVSVGTKITMYFVDKEVSGNKTDPFYIQQIKVEPYGFLLFPVEMVHIINSQSPLWKVTPYELLTKRIEIIVMVEGNSMVTGQLSQNRSSYINSDILWGHRFASCVHFDDNSEKFIISYKNVNSILQVDTPLCSAQELHEIRQGLFREN